MAAIPSSAFWTAFLPVARASILPGALTRLPIILPAAFAPIPNLIDSIWEGILKAVPKKKTSYARKRMRQLAPGKKLKDVTFLVNCSSCGRPKRAHVLCAYCVASMKQWFYTKLGVPQAMKEEAAKLPRQLKSELHLMSQKRLKDYPKTMKEMDKKIKRDESVFAQREARLQALKEQEEKPPADIDSREAI